MDFIKKLKADKSFRMKVIFVFVAVVLLYGNSGSKEMKKSWTSQAVCDVVNTDTCYEDTNPDNNFKCIDTLIGGGITQSSLEACTIARKCYIGVYLDDVLGADANYWDEYVCHSCVPAGVHVQNSQSCCSTKAEYSKYKEEGYDYICRDLEPGETPSQTQCTQGFQRTIADIVNMIPGLGQFDCMTQFYLGAFGGGALLLVLILAVM